MHFAQQRIIPLHIYIVNRDSALEPRIPRCSYTPCQTIVKSRSLPRPRGILKAMDKHPDIIRTPRKDPNHLFRSGLFSRIQIACDRHPDDRQRVTPIIRVCILKHFRSVVYTIAIRIIVVRVRAFILFFGIRESIAVRITICAVIAIRIGRIKSIRLLPAIPQPVTIKYTPPGGQISTTVTIDNGHFILRVSDTGCGIPADECEKIFELGVRGSNSLGTSGDGLGLAYVKSALEQHGGTCRCEPNNGPGTTFTVMLPLA